MSKKWDDWKQCDFTVVFNGEDTQVVRYRRMDTLGPNRAVYELVIVESTKSSRVVTFEIREIEKGSAMDPRAVSPTH